MDTPTDRTLDIYNATADDFCAGTRELDMTDHYRLFLSRLPAGAHILDLGCGSGRDSRAFLDMGYRVTAVDGSPALCVRASQYAGIPVRCLRFQELDYIAAFDGIWACASLLHVPKSEMPDVMARVSRALKPGGILYVSFKYGTTERESGGRFYNDYTEETIRTLFTDSNGLMLKECWVTNDVRADRNEKWVNAVAEKK